MTREGRPVADNGTALSALGGVDSGSRVRGDDALAYCDALRRRRAASHRLVPLDDGRRDPWARPMLGQRSTYGLSRGALLDHARSLRDNGWQPWEIDQALDLAGYAKPLPMTINQRVVTALFAEPDRCDA